MTAYDIWNRRFWAELLCAVAWISLIGLCISALIEWDPTLAYVFLVMILFVLFTTTYTIVLGKKHALLM
jgi:hypothetical protein